MRFRSGGEIGNSASSVLTIQTQLTARNAISIG